MFQPVALNIIQGFPGRDKAVHLIAVDNLHHQPDAFHTSICIQFFHAFRQEPVIKGLGII